MEEVKISASEVSGYHSVRLDCDEKLKLFYYFAYFATIHGHTALFSTIYVSHYTISTNFYFYLQYFQ